MNYEQANVDRVIKRLNQFAAMCREQQMRVFFSYPPMPETQYQESAPTVHKLHESLHKALASDVTIVNKPEDTVFPESEFFDTVTHLTESGQSLRSRALARELVPEIVAERESRTKNYR
jgi:hypothetical protein